MSDDEVFVRLNQVVERALGHSVSLARDTLARQVDGWTSLNHLEILRAAEAEFGIQIHLHEVMAIRNVGDLIDKIKAKVTT